VYLSQHSVKLEAERWRMTKVRRFVSAALCLDAPSQRILVSNGYYGFLSRVQQSKRESEYFLIFSAVVKNSWSLASTLHTTSSRHVLVLN
jgi:hypothetical protein